MPRTNPLDRFNCGPVTFSGGANALYERHLTFDQVGADRLGHATREVRGRRPLGSRPPVAALDQDRADVPRAERETGLLPVARVPDGPLSDEQHHQPVARSTLEPALPEARDRSPRNYRAGAGRRSWQRRSRPTGGVLPGFDGHARHSWHGLRPALRVRHLQADHAGRLAARAARPLARAARSVGSPAAGRSGRSAAGLLVRHPWWSAADHPGPPVCAHRHSARSPGGRVRRTNCQHAALVVCGHARLLRLPAVQRRRLRRRAGRDAHRRDAHARALPGRLHRGRQGAALPPAVLPGGLHAGRRDPPVPRRRQPLVRAAGQGGAAAERHAPDARRSPS